jgi:hypothetical protein
MGSAYGWVLSMVPGGWCSGRLYDRYFRPVGSFFQQALLASSFFGDILIPYGISLIFYGRLLKTARLPVIEQLVNLPTGATLRSWFRTDET